MRIAFLTRRFTEVLKYLIRSPWGKDLYIVDFSSEETLMQAAKTGHTEYIRFSSWENLAYRLGSIDLLISYKLNHIIPGALISKSTYGGINIHPSLLPEYPGLNPWFQMYCNLDLTGGVTIHRLSEKTDAGNILIQQSFSIAMGEPLSSAMKKSEDIAKALLKKVISDRLYTTCGVKQNPLRPSGFSIKYDELRNLKASHLWHILRGFPELITALFPELPRKRFLAGEYVENNTYNESINRPRVSPDKKSVLCKNGFIKLIEL